MNPQFIIALLLFACHDAELSELIVLSNLETHNAELIKEGKHSIKDICSMVGYNDVKYFHKCFRKYTGLTVKQISKLMHENDN